MFVLGESVSASKDEIIALSSEILAPLGVDLIEAKWIGARNARVLRLIVDTDSGVSADTCAEIIRQFDLLWESQSEKPRDFGFEVTSPGPGRHLETQRDFLRVAGKWVDVLYGYDEENLTRVIAQVETCDETALTLSGFDEPERVELSSIVQAKMVFTIGKPPTPQKTFERRTKGS